MKLEDTNGPVNHLPSKKPYHPCGHLNAISVFQEVHCDGHEKLAASALKMGDQIGVHIYGMQDHVITAPGYIYSTGKNAKVRRVMFPPFVL